MHTTHTHTPPSPPPRHPIHPPSHGTGSCGPRARPPRARCTAPAGSGARSGPWLRLLLLSRVPTTLLTAPWQRPAAAAALGLRRPAPCVFGRDGVWTVDQWFECACRCYVLIAISPGCKPPGAAQRRAGGAAHTVIASCWSTAIQKPSRRGRPRQGVGSPTQRRTHTSDTCIRSPLHA